VTPAPSALTFAKISLTKSFQLTYPNNYRDFFAFFLLPFFFRVFFFPPPIECIFELAGFAQNKTPHQG